MKELTEDEKNIILSKFFQTDFYLKEYKRFKKVSHRKAFEKYFIKKFFDICEEYISEEDGWQIISDYLGNIDIWSTSDHIIDTLYITSEGYEEPTDFISALIEFIGENLEEPIVLPPTWQDVNKNLPENPKNLEWITDLVIWVIFDGIGDCFLDVSYNFKEQQWYKGEINFEKNKFKVTHWITLENLSKMIEPK
jgi:hypothetical protein